MFKILTFVFLFLAIIAGAGCGYFYWQTQKLTTEKTALRQEIIVRASDQIISQKKQKNEIADIFDSQAALNDDLIDAQRTQIKASEDYIRLIDRSVRFVEGQPQFFPTVSEKDFLDFKNALVQKIAELNRISEENAATKTRNADRINQIYLEAGEDRNNTANEREGFR